MARSVTMSMDKYNAMPVATAKDIVEFARKLAAVLNKPLDRAMIDKAVEEMLDTHQTDQFTHDQAQLLLQIEQKPESVHFKNKRTQMIATSGNEYWQAIKQYGKETTLADMRDFIAALIEKHGADKRFYIESDQGDEYFLLTLKGK